MPMLALKEEISERIAFPHNLRETFIKLGWMSEDEEPTFAGAGEEAIVWHLSKQGFTVRIPKEDLTSRLEQKPNQSMYFFGTIGGYLMERIPSYIRIPYIWNDDTIKTPGVPEGVIVMQTISGVTLERHLIHDDLMARGIIKHASEIAGLNDRELVSTFYPGNLTAFKFYPSEKAIKRIFGSDVSSDFINTLSFLTKHGLIHNDIHNGNIMIAPDSNNPGKYFIYIIDFGKAKIEVHKASHLISEGRSGYTDSHLFSKIWEEAGIPLKE